MNSAVREKNCALPKKISLQGKKNCALRKFFPAPPKLFGTDSCAMMVPIRRYYQLFRGFYLKRGWIFLFICKYTISLPCLLTEQKISNVFKNLLFLTGIFATEFSPIEHYLFCFNISIC